MSVYFVLSSDDEEEQVPPEWFDEEEHAPPEVFDEEEEAPPEGLEITSIKSGDCNICMLPLITINNKLSTTTCGHIYHAYCINKWLFVSNLKFKQKIFKTQLLKNRKKVKKKHF
jgi:hypothetical protein